MPDHLFNGLRVTVRTAVLSPFLPKNFHNQPLAARSAKQRIAQSLHGHYWFREPSLRRRVQAGLNKGEARNALARAVFMHRLGEIRDRGLENQSYRASGLTLLTSAISLWNTVYIERAIDSLRRKGIPINEQLITICHHWDGNIST